MEGILNLHVILGGGGGQANLCVFLVLVFVLQKPALIGDSWLYICFLSFSLICPLPTYLQEFLPRLTS